jgi:hypothetical protein
MKELEYLDHCLQRVEEKYNKSPHNDWTDGDFKKLARNILNESGTIISTHTLKRLYGKIKYKEVHNPQEATKDALAKYIGYDSWDDYTKRYDPKTVSNSFIISSKVRSTVSGGKLTSIQRLFKNFSKTFQENIVY